MDTPPPADTAQITKIEVEPSDEAMVDCKCELTPQTRWQIALFATIAITVASGALYVMYLLARWLGWII